LSFLASHTHQLQGAEPQLPHQRKNNPEPYHKRYKFCDFQKDLQKIEIEFAPSGFNLSGDTMTASPLNQNQPGSETLLKFRPRKLRVAKVVAKCSKVLKYPEII
jgi:hypothetical protein